MFTLMAEVSQLCSFCLCFSDHLGVDSYGQNRMVLFIVSHLLVSKSNLFGHMQWCMHTKTERILAGILPSLSLLSANESHKVTFHSASDYCTARRMTFLAI